MSENKNILIKIWGSLLAPKNSQKKNFNVIKFLSEIIKKFPDKKFFIINWTWNVWHSFVEKNFLNEKNILILQNNLKKFFSEIEKKFPEDFAWVFLQVKNELLNWRIFKLKKIKPKKITMCI